MRPGRIFAAAVVLGAFGVAFAIGLLVRDRGGAPSADAAIDWTAPTELPPTTADGYSPVTVQGGLRYEPISGRVIASEAYRFDTGPCGLGWLVDFDGSFWQPLDAGSIPSALMSSEDRGAIALTDFDAAVYRSSGGVDVTLGRISGPVITQPCG
jgi:hypothetical protein